MRVFLVILVLITALFTWAVLEEKSHDYDQAARTDLANNKIDCEAILEKLEELEAVLSPVRFTIHGIILEKGRCGPPDPIAAMFKYWNGAKLRDRDSYLMMARAYDEGLWGDPDPEEAQYWMRKWLLSRSYRDDDDTRDYLRYNAKASQFGYPVPAFFDREIDWYVSIRDLSRQDQYALAVKVLNGDGYPQSARFAHSIFFAGYQEEHVPSAIALARGVLERRFWEYDIPRRTQIWGAEGYIRNVFHLDDPRVMRFGSDYVQRYGVKVHPGYAPCAWDIRADALDQLNDPPLPASCQDLSPEDLNGARTLAEKPFDDFNGRVKPVER